MQIKILGTRGKVPHSAPKHVLYSGVLIDQKILVDLGEAKFLDYRPEAILFTHFHPDHAFFIFDKEVFDPEIPLFGPEKQELAPRIRVITRPFKLNSYLITPVPVIHALHLKSYGYLIEKDEKRIFITGDVAWIEKAKLQQLPRVDLILTEASFIQKGGMIRRKEDHIFGHTGVPDLVRILGPYTSRIAFMHYGSWFFKDIKQARKKLAQFAGEDLEIIPAHDGLVVNV